MYFDQQHCWRHSNAFVAFLSKDAQTWVPFGFYVKVPVTKTTLLMELIGKLGTPFLLSQRERIKWPRCDCNTNKKRQITIKNLSAQEPWVDFCTYKCDQDPLRTKSLRSKGSSTMVNIYRGLNVSCKIIQEIKTITANYTVLIFYFLFASFYFVDVQYLLIWT